MYLYKKEMYNNFKFPFDGLENIEQSYSQALQDMFVLSALNGKRNGTFLEIGASTPVFISNSYLLEKFFDWNGICVEIDSSLKSLYDAERSCHFFGVDALTLNYKNILGNNKRQDYISLDIEPMGNTLACLKLLPLDEYRFSVITYETDFYSKETPIEYNEEVRKESRKILQSLGYVLVNGNAENMGNDPYEDWYLDGQYFDTDTINKFKRDNDNPLKARCYMLRNVE
jgi:hypothetical protein